MINGISPGVWPSKNVQFFDLVNLLKTTIGPNPNSTNFRSLTAARELTITSHYLKNM